MDKNTNLPAEVYNNLQEIGTITYANEVIAIIAGMAASEIDGVATMGASSSIADILGRNRRPVTKGVKVEVGSEEASVDIVLSVEYGKPIQRVCRDVQESVRKAIETMTGLHVVKVDVHVLGVSFERETQAIAEGASIGGITAGSGAPDTGRRGQPIRARREERAAKTEVIAPPETKEEPPVSEPVPDFVVQPPLYPYEDGEPETANSLPRPIELDGEDEAVFVSATAAVFAEDASTEPADAGETAQAVEEDEGAAIIMPDAADGLSDRNEATEPNEQDERDEPDQPREV